MPIIHRWIIPRRVIYVRWYGEITIAEAHDANRNTGLFIEEGIAPVHMLRDDSGITKIPHVSPRQTLEALKAVRDPRFGWAVNIGYSNALVRVLIDLYSKFTRIRIHRAETLEEALAFLKKVDASLPLEDVRWDIEHS
jgi:hypothetical protein